MTAQVNIQPRGRQFFNNPGPTNIPDRILRAMDRPVMDFLAPEFLEMHRACYAGMKRIFKTDQEVYFHASTAASQAPWPVEAWKKISWSVLKTRLASLGSTMRFAK